jgi:hypothetical protein
VDSPARASDFIPRDEELRRAWTLLSQGVQELGIGLDETKLAAQHAAIAEADPPPSAEVRKLRERNAHREHRGARQEQVIFHE